ncbi:hypothetical protein SPHINGO391_440272 [Sphingomonas aurantiaca]|uniref:Uncharacterized protein n=1 Tax=Sphingomonas aurantiaca TaxID=185949 RepID=A0A5E7Z7V3_9SPHN|nr:hypothetical protein SPHINGO391_440272 [Sphingomonas aurantiaca]
MPQWMRPFSVERDGLKHGMAAPTLGTWHEACAHSVALGRCDKRGRRTARSVQSRKL